MPWAKFDDEFDDDPELDLIGPVAACLFTCSVTWCSRNLTDGFVPRSRAFKLTGGSEESVFLLLKYEWWVEEPEGFRVRNYLKYNPSAEQVEAERSRSNERQKNYQSRRRGRGNKPYNNHGPQYDIVSDITNTVIHSVNDTVNNARNNAVDNESALTNTVIHAGSRIPYPDSQIPDLNHISESVIQSLVALGQATTGIGADLAMQHEELLDLGHIETLKEKQVKWFGEFWDVYAYKTGTSKSEAKKSYCRVVQNQTMADTVMAGLRRAIKSEPWQNPLKLSFRKHPATWLNQKCWTDEYEVYDPRVVNPRNGYSQPQPQYKSVPYVPKVNQ